MGRLQEKAARKTSTQKADEMSFTNGLEHLFDIAPAYALSIIFINKDKEFFWHEEKKAGITVWTRLMGFY